LALEICRLMPVSARVSSKEQARPVAPVDLDDGVLGARHIVDEDARRHGEDIGAADERRRRAQLEMRLQPSAQHVLEMDGEARQLVRPGRKAPPLASCTQNVSSAMPFAIVMMRASTMLAPETASAPATREKSPDGRRRRA